MENNNLIRKLKKFMSFGRKEGANSISERLKAMNFNPEEIRKTGRDLANKYLSQDIQEKRQNIKRERVAAQEKATSFLKGIAFDSIEKVNEAINSIRQGKLGGEAQRYAQAYFKNFEKATLEDKVSLLKDIELLKHLSE